MARARSYPQADFKESQKFLATDPSRSQVVRVPGDSILEAAVDEILQSGNVVNSIDTLTEAISTDYASGQYVLTGGELVVLDGGQAIYRVSDPGSGGIAMDNGNELVLEFVANTPANIITPIASVADLFGLTGVAGQQISVGEYNVGTGIGGGPMVYDATLVRSNHNGGTIHSPARDLATEGRDAYLTASVDADLGCWVRPNVEYVTPEMFGAYGDLISNDTASLKSSISYLSGGGLVIAERSYLIAETLSIPTRVTIDLNNSGIIEQSADGIPIITFSEGGAVKSRMQVKNGRLRYTNQQTDSNAIGVILSDTDTITSRWLLQNLSFQKCYRSVSALDDSDTYLARMVDVTSTDSEDYAYYFGGSSSVHTNILIDNCWAYQTPSAERPNGRGFRLQNIQELDARNIAVDNAQGIPVFIQTCKGTISNIAIESCDRSLSAGVGYHVGVNGSQIDIGTLLVTGNNVTISGSAAFASLYASNSTVRTTVVTDNDTNLDDTSSDSYYTIYTADTRDQIYNDKAISSGTSPAISTNDGSKNLPRRIRTLDGVAQLLELDGVCVGTKGSIPTTTDYPEQSIVLNSIRTNGAPLGWQLISGAWVTIGEPQQVTSADLDDISSTANTVGKYDGAQVYNTTTNRPLWSSGSTAGDVWRDAAGVTQHTPT